MQVILMEKVVNLGGLGDVVKVKDGFARNFLIPQGKAKRASEKNLKEFEGRRSDLEKKANEHLTSAQERGAKLEGLKVDISQKAGAEAGSSLGHPTAISQKPSASRASRSRSRDRMPAARQSTSGIPITIQLHRMCSRISPWWWSRAVIVWFPLTRE